MVEDIREYVEVHREEILKTFDVLHSIPEPGFQEKKTSKYIQECLQEAGFEVKSGFAETAVLGTYDTGKPGPRIGLRADMDALRYEKDGEVYHVHSCGHDANCTGVIWAAKAIKDTGSMEKGCLYVLFQPAEEVLTGAKTVIDSGVLNDLEYLIGTHLRPQEELPMGKVVPAVFHGASGHMKVIVHGHDAHGARPQQGTNAILAAVGIINAVTALPFDPTIPHSVKPTKINSGSNPFNVIPDRVEIIFDMRAQTNEQMQRQRELVERAAVCAARAAGAEAETEWLGGVPAASRCDELIDLASAAIRDSLGDEGFAQAVFTSGGEDFHNYPLAIPGLKSTVIGVGAGLTPGLHKVDMQFDHSAIWNCVTVMSCIVDYIAKQ